MSGYWSGVGGLAGAAVGGIYAAQGMINQRERLKRIREVEMDQSIKRIKAGDGGRVAPPPMRRPRTRTALRRRRPTKRRGRIYRPRRALTMQPKTMVRELKTVTFAALNPAAGAIDIKQLQLNSANDPTGTLNTEQPRFYDQYTAMYSYNCVIGWKVFIEYATSGDDAVAVVVGFTPTTTTTNQADYASYKELPATKSLILTKDVDKSALGAAGSVKRWLMPRGGRILTERDLCAVSNTNPSQMLYGHVWAQAIDKTADPALINCIITIKQVVVFFNPVVPAQS